MNRVLELPAGAGLREPLFAHGVEFPCGGKGRCKGCRVRVTQGELPPGEADRRLLTAGEVADGWRLGCRARVTGDLTLEVAQWEATILSDDSAVSFTPQGGLGVAIDLGTTTLALQLLDRTNGRVLAVRTALNQQAVHGADVMSRVHFATEEGGALVLRDLVRQQLGGLLTELRSEAACAAPVEEVVLVGNTAMHHLFAGLDAAPLAHAPFESAQLGEMVFRGDELGWSDFAGAMVRFLPCLGGFVGSDILAGIFATRLDEGGPLRALIDLGTNGEIVVGHGERLLCASTAAGPAFEGARIGSGMRAATGAIAEVNLVDGQYACRVLGGGSPRGICGSGLVDAVACGLDRGDVQPSGRLANGAPLELRPPVRLEQRDIRELQLAKGAIAAGVRLLVERFGAGLEDVAAVHLAGAFGNYISRANARRIGLLSFPPERVIAAGNTALLGAKMVLLRAVDPAHATRLCSPRIEHVSLNEDPRFHEVYVDEMAFPSKGSVLDIDTSGLAVRCGG
ncbi:MAG: DUF4445 domain-containing protein [Verrucomicrobiales bacterium]|nr:DUF4445 domain-containing protein [Verrucomicrobiales bacterium]